MGKLQIRKNSTESTQYKKGSEIADKPTQPRLKGNSSESKTVLKGKWGKKQARMMK